MTKFSNTYLITSLPTRNSLHHLADIGAANRLKEINCCFFSFCLKLEGFLYAPLHDGVDGLRSRALFLHQVFKVLERFQDAEE